MGAKATGFDLRFDVSGPSDDGTLLALCRDMPIIIAATSEQELSERIAKAVKELVSRLQSMEAGQDLKFLKEAGVKMRRVTVGAEKRTVTVPVSLSVSSR